MIRFAAYGHHLRELGGIFLNDLCGSLQFVRCVPRIYTVQLPQKGAMKLVILIVGKWDQLFILF